MPKKRNKTTITKSLDRIASKAMRSKYPKCQKCGFKSTQVHHIHGRRNYSVRWTPMNLLPLCAGCHTYKTDSFEQSPYDEGNIRVVEKWLKKHNATMGDLQQLANGVYKSTLEELIELENHWKQALKSCS